MSPKGKRPSETGQFAQDLPVVLGGGFRALSAQRCYLDC